MLLLGSGTVSTTGRITCSLSESTIGTILNKIIYYTISVMDKHGTLLIQKDSHLLGIFLSDSPGPPLASVIKMSHKVMYIYTAQLPYHYL